MNRPEPGAATAASRGSEEDGVTRRGRAGSGVAEPEAPQPERRRWQLPAERLPLALAAVALLALVLVAPLRRAGDSSDYILATESLLFDRDLRYTPEDEARHLRRRPPGLDSPAGLHVAPGRDGATWLGHHHSFYYSLAAAPVVAAFGLRGFLLFNAAVFWLFLAALYSHLRRFNPPTQAWCWLGLAVVFSASWTYVLWIHTEVFMLGLVAGFLWAWSRQRLGLAAALLGAAVAVNPTLVLLLPALALILWRERRSARAVLGMVAVAIAAGLPQVLYNLYAFGAVHPLLGHTEHHPELLFTDRVFRNLFDPAVGLLWFYPAVILAVTEAPRRARTWLMYAGAFSVLWGTTQMANWYNHQVGVRYAAWLFPVFLFSVERVHFAGWPRRLGWAFAVFSATGLAANPIGNSTTDLSVDSRTFLPYRVIRRLLPYPEDGAVRLSRMGRLQGVFVTGVAEDGWSRAGQPAEILVATGRGTVRFTLEGWRRVDGATQSYRLWEEGGEAIAGSVAAGGRVTLEFAPRAAGAHPWRFFRVESTPWVPSLDGGTEALTGDPRSLGVRVHRVADGDRILFSVAP